MRSDWTTHWRRFRRVFRWCRIGALLLVLGAVVLVIYLTANDVPAFVRAAVTTQLRNRGLDVTFESLRFRWYRGLTADGVRYVGGGTTNSNQLDVDIGQLAIRLDWRALLRRQVEIRAVTLGEARVRMNLAPAGDPPADFVVEVILAQILFQPDGLWELEQLQLRCLDMNLRLAGRITNAPALRQWPRPVPPTAPPPEAPPDWRRQARQWIALVREIHFTSSPDIRGTFRGDARDPASFGAEFRGHAAGARTRWGTLGEFSLLARLNDAPPTAGNCHSTAELTVADAWTDWGQLAQGFLRVEVANPPASTVPAAVNLTLKAVRARTPHASFASAEFRASGRPSPADGARWLADFDLAASEIRTDWASAQSNQLSGTVRYVIGARQPEEVTVKGQFGQVKSQWGTVSDLGLETAVRPQPAAPVPADGGWWTNLAPYSIQLGLKARDLQARGYALDSLAVETGWITPWLTVTNLQAGFAGGTLRVNNTRLDLAQRRLEFDLETELDVGRLPEVLPNLVTGFGHDFVGDQPSRLALTGGLDLTRLFASGPATPAAVLAALTARLKLFSGPFRFRGVSFDGLEVEGGWETGTARVDRLRLARPEGDLESSGELNPDSGRFSAAIRSTLDPGAFRPLVAAPGGGPLALFNFRLPPRIEAELHGRLGGWDTLGVRANVAATNFVFRGDPLDTFHVGLTFTNLFLVATNAALRTGDQWVDAPAIGLDLRTSWLYFTNARSQIDPMRVARAINTNVVRAIERYHFSQPPLVEINGSVPVAGSVAAAAMRFALDGGPFQFWRFNLPQVRGTVLWQGEQVIVTNLAAAFYGGELKLNLGVAIQPAGDANFQFQAAFTDAQLGAAVTGLTEATNRLQGLVTGSLNVTYANSADFQSWEGSGELAMRDGYLWDFPVFSVLSRTLNLLVPGIGNLKASASRGTFTLQHSVIHTKDFQVRATPLRLLCRGSVDMAGNVNGEVEAEILRDVPLFGPLVSFALSPVSKALIFRIGNKLNNPRIEPIMVPWFLRSVLGLSRAPASPPATTEEPPPINAVDQ